MEAVLPEHGEFEQFELRVPADEFTRYQIAGVTIHWSILELTVERVIDALQGGSGVVEYTDTVERRVDLMKKLAKRASLGPEQLNHLLAIAIAILGMRSTVTA